MNKDILEISAALCDVAHQPVLITREGAVSLHQTLLQMRYIENPEAHKVDAMAYLADIGTDVPTEYTPYGVRAGNVAVISVTGSLVHTPGRAFAYSWATSYQGVQRMVKEAVLDNHVDTIAMVYHTGGGVVYNCFDTADSIREARSEKRIVGIANDVAASAGYALISASSEIIVTQTGEVGSIGVRAMHISIEKMLEDAGVVVTEVYAGKQKVDFSMYHNLSADEEKRMQTRINESYDQFVDLVATNRDNLTEKAIRKTEAGMYRAESAIEAGLADKVDSLGGALASLINTTAQPGITQQRERTFMKTPQSPENGQKTPAEIQAEALTRMTTVMAHPKFDANKAMATEMLGNVALTTDAITGFLDKAPDVAAATEKETKETQKADALTEALSAIGLSKEQLEAASSLKAFMATIGAENPLTESGSAGTGDRPESSGDPLVDLANKEKAPAVGAVLVDADFYAKRNASMQRTNIANQQIPDEFRNAS